ncbi:MAG: GNAT family N-acetyltransferase, partial [Beijerinckiaceae bacterium]
RIPHPYPEGEAERAVFEQRKANALGEHLVMAITLKSKPNQLIGIIGLHPKAAAEPSAQRTLRPGEAGARAELGYWLGTDHWGKGLVTEAARAMIDAAFSLTAVSAVHAGVRVINPASRRVLEKCGFRHDGTALKTMPARGGAYPRDEFSLSRRDWADLKAWGAYGLPISGLAPPALFVAPAKECEAAV